MKDDEAFERWFISQKKHLARLNFPYQIAYAGWNAGLLFRRSRRTKRASDGLKSPAKNRKSTADGQSPAKKRKVVTSRA
jgi:hypothetical protein